jgi:hypothetical protein
LALRGIEIGAGFAEKLEEQLLERSKTKDVVVTLSDMTRNVELPEGD